VAPLDDQCQRRVGDGLSALRGASLGSARSGTCHRRNLSIPLLPAAP
jgi:hypothetical protein